jgi:tRNA(fMet)-specific endonuclease VapC
VTHLLDTNTCVAVLRQKPGVAERLQRLAPAEVAVSMVTVYELFCGVEKARNPEAERQKVERFLSVVPELPFDRAAAEIAAQVRVSLEKRGEIIGPYDLLIAGQALAADLVLVTSNLREFERVEGLKLESWV